MIVCDTDVLTEILMGNPVFVARAAVIPRHEQAVPIVVLEEIMRGRLHVHTPGGGRAGYVRLVWHAPMTCSRRQPEICNRL